MASSEMPDAQNEHGPAPRVYESSGVQVNFSLEPLSHFDPAQVAVEPVEPVDGLFGRFGGRCMVLRNALSPEECQYLITEMTQAGTLEQVTYRHDYRRNDRCVFETRELAELLWERVQGALEGLAVLASDADQPQRQRLVENGADPADDAEIPDCPEELQLGFFNSGLWRPIGLNECLRFCKYNPGGFFRQHCDATFRRNDEEISLFTCMFYLDGGLKGGATRFLRSDGQDAFLSDKNYLKQAEDHRVLASVTPEPGMCLLFFQPGLLHEGEELLEGPKHILRTDVMFRRDPSSKPQQTPEEAEAWKLAMEATAAEAAGECDKACALYRRAFKLHPKLERMF